MAVSLEGFQAECDFSHLKSVLSVLVEEEEGIRRSWLAYFRERGMRLLVFESAEAFLAGYRPDGDPVEFFFDQDFGANRRVGLRLAALVHGWEGRTGTSLVTSYPPSAFEEQLSSGILDNVLAKFPESIFGPGYHEIHVQQQIREKGLGRFVSDSLDRIRSAFDDLDSAIVASGPGAKPGGPS